MMPSALALSYFKFHGSFQLVERESPHLISVDNDAHVQVGVWWTAYESAKNSLR